MYCVFSKFKSAKLTITEIFMSEEIGEGGKIKIEQIDKIKDVVINYDTAKKKFIANSSINYTGESKYKNWIVVILPLKNFIRNIKIIG